MLPNSDFFFFTRHGNYCIFIYDPNQKEFAIRAFDAFFLRLFGNTKPVRPKANEPGVVVTAPHANSPSPMAGAGVSG